MAENGGKEPSISNIMREVGYSKETARNPKKLTGAKGWKALLDEFIPDEALLETIKEAFYATKIHGSPTEPDKVIPDHAIRLKAVELALKIKGRLSDQQINRITNLEPSGDPISDSLNGFS